MTVELISVGTEILLGNIVNTNANYLAGKCAQLGLSSYYQVSVGDNEARLCSVIETALSRSDIIILSGGLGPTQDDITKEAAAKVLKRSLIMDEHSRERITSYFQSVQAIQPSSGNVQSALSVISENNWKQAMKIEDSIVIDNNNGTAPGYIVETENKNIILLPGPPNELIPMFEQAIFPYLKKLQNKVFVSKIVKITGIGESRAETQILDLIERQTNPTIAPYAKTGEVHFRITAAADREEAASELLQPVLEELSNRFHENIYTMEEADTLESVVISLLSKNHLTLATAESCTGGLLTGRIVNVPGVSDILQEGFITYSNDAKMKYLGVSEETLKRFGAVSEQTAREMAVGAAKAAKADASLSVTGIAGPDGGTPEKPVGLVYISCYLKDHITVKECRFRGSREKIREQSVIYALDLLRRSLLTYYKP